MEVSKTNQMMFSKIMNDVASGKVDITKNEPLPLVRKSADAEHPSQMNLEIQSQKYSLPEVETTPEGNKNFVDNKLRKIKEGVPARNIPHNKTIVKNSDGSTTYTYTYNDGGRVYTDTQKIRENSDGTIVIENQIQAEDFLGRDIVVPEIITYKPNEDGTLTETRAACNRYIGGSPKLIFSRTYDSQGQKVQQSAFEYKGETTIEKRTTYLADGSFEITIYVNGKKDNNLTEKYQQIDNSVEIYHKK